MQHQAPALFYSAATLVNVDRELSEGNKGAGIMNICEHLPLFQLDLVVTPVDRVRYRHSLEIAMTERNIGNVAVTDA